ncbi:hypothetical protein FO519_009764 [Halicephalobus sp. NKZ332]|nr:hypothetical protein FO519_009764 [Halicephalobus sp. NKZ332]
MVKLSIAFALDADQGVRIFNVSVDDDISLDDFKEVVAKTSLIPKQYLIIKLGDVHLYEDHKLLRDIGIKTTGLQLRVEHCYLHNWKSICESADRIDKMHGMEQSDVALEILDTINVLKEAKFFVCYPSFSKRKSGLVPRVCEYLGGHRGTTEASVRQFFFSLYNGEGTIHDPSTFRVKFNLKPGGIHIGCVCVVSHDGLSNVFYVKTHHTGPEKSSSKALSVPDLREIFCYALLEKIGMGPECHFFSSIPGTSKSTLYIATKAIPGLILMENLTPTTTNIKETVIQIHTLCFLLCLGDVHGRNCGQDENQKAVLFDFCVPPRSGYKESVDNFFESNPQCVDTMVNVRKVSAMSEMAKSITAMQRKAIALEALRAWNLENVIPSVVERINKTKNSIRSRGGIIEGTDDFNKYLEGVNYNISLLSDKI